MDFFVVWSFLKKKNSGYSGNSLLECMVYAVCDITDGQIVRAVRPRRPQATANLLNMKSSDFVGATELRKQKEKRKIQNPFFMSRSL